MKSHPMVMKTLVENSVKYANIHNDLPETQNINVLGCCPACMCAYLCRGILLSCPKSKPGRVKISAIHSSKILNGCPCVEWALFWIPLPKLCATPEGSV